MLDQIIIEKLTQWLEKNAHLEIKLRNEMIHEVTYSELFLDQNKLYSLWQKEANTEDDPLIIIDFENNIKLYLALSYNDDENLFTGYLICEIVNNKIKPIKHLKKLELYKDLWTCSIGLPSPNEIILYETAKNLNLKIEKNRLDRIQKINDNYVEGLDIEIFYSTINNDYQSDWISLTDLDQNLLRYNQFLDTLIDEVQTNFPTYQNKEEIEFRFGLYYLQNQHLIPLTPLNYEEIIEKYADGYEEYVFFYTENKDKAYNLYGKMRYQKEKYENLIEEKIEQHNVYINSINPRKFRI